MLECVSGPVDAGAFPVPDTEYAVDGLVGIGLDLLRAEYRRGRKVFVDGGQKLDVVFFEKGFGAPEFLVDGAER